MRKSLKMNEAIMVNAENWRIHRRKIIGKGTGYHCSRFAGLFWDYKVTFDTLAEAVEYCCSH